MRILGNATPRVRKWRRVKKSGSCPAADHQQTSKDTQSQGSNVPVFGQPLSFSPTCGENDFVPLFVQFCIKVVEAHGIDSVGIYRIPGNTAAVNALTASLDKGFQQAGFSDPRWKDVNVVSSLLKAYFRKLPEPILTDKYYPIFIDANRITDHANRLKKLSILLHKLPKHNQETLKYLLNHLKKVADRSEVNKMEARNLALMFGPSCVRPSGDNMAAMVTHMSDQCKIMESLILYCDWLYGNSGDSPPGPPTEVQESVMTSSFSDMSDLLRRVNRSDEELEKTKDRIVKSIWNVRKGSKKKSCASVAAEGRKSKQHQPLPCRKTVSDRPLTSAALKRQKETYEERNIDEEIENRSSAVQKDDETQPTDLNLAVDELRRQREEQIYSARRIFISGSSVSEVANNNADAENENEKLNGLVRHTRHLNLSGCAEPAMDVLSPETREKIRRLQADGQLLRLKGQRQNLQVKKVESARQRVERAWERAKADAEQDDYLDVFAEDPVHTDALSVTSDYSTTSSATGAEGLVVPSSSRALMSHSCNGALPLSDYSSTGSPLTPHLPQKTDSLTQSEASVESAGSENVPCEQSNSIYDRRRLRHIVPVANRASCPRTCSIVAREKAWYELDEEEKKYKLTTNSPNVTVDQNRNLTQTVVSKNQNSGRTICVNEKPISRLSQKIRFRSKSSSRDKRKDPRRHTLTDLEHLKTALFGEKHSSSSSSGGSFSDNRLVSRRHSQKAQRSNSGAHLALGKVAKVKTGKLKAWFKESFRKSSPDLFQSGTSEPEPLNLTAAVI